MDVTVYLSKDMRYVLVPTCFLPSNDCEHIYGPLQRCAAVPNGNSLDTSEWSRVIRQIEQHDYAVIGAEAAHRLLGEQHWCLPPADLGAHAQFELTDRSSPRPRMALAASK